jgi:hypothetical protein
MANSGDASNVPPLARYNDPTMALRMPPFAQIKTALGVCVIMSNVSAGSQSRRSTRS